MDTQEIFNRLMTLRNKIEADTEAAMLDSDNALLYDVARTLGLSDEQAATLAGDDKPQPVISAYPPQHEPTEAECYDFDGGFGIGGINRRQPTAAEEIELLDAQLRAAEREAKRVRKGPMPNGQLWEPCPSCKREPVCLDCGLCERHCNC